MGKMEARRSHSESGLKIDGGEVPNAKSSSINIIFWIKTSMDSPQSKSKSLLSSVHKSSVVNRG